MCWTVPSGARFSERRRRLPQLRQTLRLLVCKPGQLTREYWEGRRNRFIGPVKLYLIFFAVMLLL